MVWFCDEELHSQFFFFLLLLHSIAISYRLLIIILYLVIIIIFSWLSDVYFILHIMNSILYSLSDIFCFTQYLDYILTTNHQIVECKGLFDLFALSSFNRNRILIK